MSELPNPNPDVLVEGDTLAATIDDALPSAPLVPDQTLLRAQQCPGEDEEGKYQ